MLPRPSPSSQFSKTRIQNMTFKIAIFFKHTFKQLTLIDKYTTLIQTHQAPSTCQPEINSSTTKKKESEIRPELNTLSHYSIQKRTKKIPCLHYNTHQSKYIQGIKITVFQHQDNSAAKPKMLTNTINNVTEAK